ncbi:MAG TPA: enoyl-CoA hydratase-related protein [Thermoanaerobaculia bacterium]|nr:enoyl-CoA hydratase-related protein [Thermoanaerobaculia bacterium]
MSSQTLRVEEDHGVLTIALHRPEVHNAFNDELIEEMIDLLERMQDRTDLRVAVLRGDGANFCAGADLNWMSRMVSWGRDENVRDSAKLAKMFLLLNEFPVPVVGRIQGAAIGGGVGLVSICDVAIAEENTKFGLSEVKLGILPAVISPYVIAKIGTTYARALFLSGERFDGKRAAAIGLVHATADGESALDRLVDEKVQLLLGSGPEAVRECKRLISYVAGHELADAIPYTIEAIATRRASEEGQAGMKAFLRKARAPWAAK